MLLEKFQNRLSNLQSADDLRGLFADLSYEVDFVPIFLQRATKADEAAQECLAGDIEILAKYEDFDVIYAPLSDWAHARSAQRLIISRLLGNHRFALWVFSDAKRENWHLVNVKTGAGKGKAAMSRHVLRRFSFSRGEIAGRTSVEQLRQLDLAAFIGTGLEVQERHNEAFDVSEVTKKFFEDFKVVFGKVESNVRGIDGANAKEKADRVRDWTQRLFNRLMFLRFLEKKGWLQYEGDSNYLSALWKAKGAKEDFLSDRLYWAFFYGLNTAGENIAVHSEAELIARRGHVPFLNGGLFDLTDEYDVKGAVTFKSEREVFISILDLFERYNFTVTESTPFDQEVGIDPEMLGKVFEELTNERTESGSYYTPRVVVSFMARAALKGYLQKCDTTSAIEAFVENGDASKIKRPEKVLEALKEVRVCDPACGSGAYLLGVMQELLRLREALFASHEIDPLEQYDRKLEIIERNLYGADLTEFAVNIAMLRLWLSLVVDYNGPVEKLPALPNLQYKIGQGDSLTAPDPTDKGKVYHSAYKPLAKELAVLHDEWFEESYKRSKGKKTRAKSVIKHDIDAKMAEISRKIGKAPDEAHDWRLRFAEVFAHDGFDIVIANPPYGASVADSTRSLYFKGSGQSKDTYGLFMARGLQLLKPGGWFTFIVSDTWRTIKSHKQLRMLLLEKACVSHVIDLPSWIFGATVNTGVLTFQKGVPEESQTLIAADVRGLAKGEWDALGNQLRAVAGEGKDEQTFETVRYTYNQSLIGTYDNASFFIANPVLYELLSDRKRFQPLGELAEIPQGISTGQNKYYVRRKEVGEGYDSVDDSLVLRPEEIAALSQDEKLNGVNPKKYNGRHFVPFDKGGESDSDEGWMPNYYVPTQFFIDWSQAALKRMRSLTIEERKKSEGKFDKINKGDDKKIAAALRNPDAWFRPAVTFSPTGIYAPTFRVGCSAIFGNKGSTILSTKLKANLILALASSLLSRYLLKNYLSHTVETGEEVLTRLPIPYLATAIESKLDKLVTQIIEKQKAEPRYAYWLHEGPQIDALIYELYGLSQEQIREVEIWYCRRYSRPAQAQGVWERVETQYGL